MVELPQRIHRLSELAYDLWWSWTTEARTVFRQLDYPLWRFTAHNPVRMLQLIPQAMLESAVADPVWLAAYDRAVAMLDATRASAAHGSRTRLDA